MNLIVVFIFYSCMSPTVDRANNYPVLTNWYLGFRLDISGPPTAGLRRIQTMPSISAREPCSTRSLSAKISWLSWLSYLFHHLYHLDYVDYLDYLDHLDNLDHLDLIIFTILTHLGHLDHLDHLHFLIILIIINWSFWSTWSFSSSLLLIHSLSLSSDIYYIFIRI